MNAFLKTTPKKILFPHLVNNSVQNCNIQSLIKIALMKRKTKPCNIKIISWKQQILKNVRQCLYLVEIYRRL